MREPGDIPLSIPIELCYDRVEDSGSLDELGQCLRVRGEEDGRAKFILNLGDKRKQERVKHELERIKNVRERFFNNPAKQELVDEHLELHRKWKKEAKENWQRDMNEYEQKSKAGRSMTVLEMESKILKKVMDWPSNPPVQIRPSIDPSHPVITDRDRLNYAIKASIMYFDCSGRGFTKHSSDPELMGEFPNQKIRIVDLLSPSRENPLTSKMEENTLRYIHLPTNNMVWIEKLLGIYYGEQAPEISISAPHQERSALGNLLARENWRGQMHGSDNQPIHARYMRSFFAVVPASSIQSGIDVSHLQAPQRITCSTQNNLQSRPPGPTANFHNFTIFMPYLHWESNARRTKMAKIVEDVMGEYQASIREKDVPKRATTSRKDGKKQEKLLFLRTVEKAKLKAKYEGKHVARSMSLGPFLMSVARIFEEMDYEADEKLLRDHLQSSTIHLRRTLDQSYFWGLEDTTARDKDQVVYRRTRAGIPWNPRVVMVDQLWMWILDENTILTSFPRRWGRNKPDSSGVHKSLRQRLSDIEPGDIKSIFDLALIIIDQCSRVFFDRTKPTDERPEVMDIFSRAIFTVTKLKTVASGGFWTGRRLDAKYPKRQDKPQSSSATSYLNINPEGTLLDETQDILEELMMMSQIFTQQIRVVENFKNALEKFSNLQVEEEKLKAQNIKSKVTQASPSLRHSLKPTTLVRAADVLEQIEARKREIGDLSVAAELLIKQLQDLLGMKQQQVGIIEAQISAELANQSVQQGQAVMLFTIVTIFFLPLSFFASVFSMSTVEWNENPLTLREQFTLMFPISLCVILGSLILAFNDIVRDFIMLICRFCLSLFQNRLFWHLKWVLPPMYSLEAWEMTRESNLKKRENEEQEKYFGVLREKQHEKDRKSKQKADKKKARESDSKDDETSPQIPQANGKGLFAKVTSINPSSQAGESERSVHGVCSVARRLLGSKRTQGSGSVNGRSVEQV